MKFISYRHHSYIVTTVIYLRILTLLESDGNVYIGNVGGDVIRFVVTRHGNMIGKNITINRQHLERLSSEYAEESNQIY